MWLFWANQLAELTAQYLLNFSGNHIGVVDSMWLDNMASHNILITLI